MATTLQVTTDARPECVPALRNLVAQLARDTGFSDADTYAIKTCVGEAAANAALHAYPKGEPGLVKVSLCAEGDELDVAVADEGRVHATPGEDDRLHLGLRLVTRLAENCVFTAAPDGTRVEMHFSHRVPRRYETPRAERLRALYP